MFKSDGTSSILLPRKVRHSQTMPQVSRGYRPFVTNQNHSQFMPRVPSNTFAIYGNGEDKELTELVPGILNQLGPDSLASLRKLAESYQNMQKAEGVEGVEKEADDDDNDIPDLVAGENFEDKVE